MICRILCKSFEVEVTSRSIHFSDLLPLATSFSRGHLGVKLTIKTRSLWSNKLTLFGTATTIDFSIVNQASFLFIYFSKTVTSVCFFIKSGIIQSTRTLGINISNDNGSRTSTKDKTSHCELSK